MTRFSSPTRRPSPTGLMTALTLLFLAALPILFRDQQSAEATVPSYEALLTIGADGTVNVRETFTVDYAEESSTGLLRRVRQRDGDRVYRVTSVEVASPTFAPVNLTVRDFMHERQLRIGADRPVSGRHTYVLSYDLVGVLREGGAHDELLWDVLGPGWPHPIADATVRLRAPVVFAAGCLAGRARAHTPCAGGPGTPGTAEFRQSALLPREGMVVRAAFTPGALSVPVPTRAPAHFGFTPWGWLVLLAAAPLGMVVHGRSPVWLRGAMLAGGAVLVVWDVLDDVIDGGVWRAAVDDKLLSGLMLLTLGYLATRRAR
ncbi:DUF2207 domain-containing protein [Actinocorallia sp. API 0066]|uniref:DUF2207 domain-containing protein n=1 Tax=Actinocorallia sp. API 0066 TaxID=2896846 RepID=UPI001E5FCE46|nr:DUF2207 domain-containing protein [Actinocorallia sp. API 0066]MCD0451320.1 DUF2207 domain-containing protein [Actinocorallia sp. API 0066]